MVSSQEKSIFECKWYAYCIEVTGVEGSIQVWIFQTVYLCTNKDHTEIAFRTFSFLVRFLSSHGLVRMQKSTTYLLLKHNKSPKYLYRVQSMHEQRTHSVRSAKHFEKYLGHCLWCMYKFAWTFFLLAISKPIYLKKAIFFDIFNGTALQTSKVPWLINKLWKQDIFQYALVSFDHFETQKSYDIQS